MEIENYETSNLSHAAHVHFVFFFSLLIKSRKKYIDIIGPKDRWTNRIFSKIKQILGIKPILF